MSGPISISVALCTCNGQRFLDEQLFSLASQRHLPTELVVCDDASDDNTWQILEEFEHNAPFPVRLYRNSCRLGITKNFERAIRLCSGDVIALCDQDDVWLPEKLTRYAERLAIGFDSICCDAQVVNAELTPFAYTHWDRLSFDKGQRQISAEGRLIEVLTKHYVVAGATLAFRTELRNQLLPIPSDWLYDAWLAAMLSASGKSTIVDECLQLYRQHEHNAVGGKHQGIAHQLRAVLDVNRSQYLNLEISRWQHLFERLVENHASDNSVQFLKEKLAHLRRRLHFHNNRMLRIPQVLFEIFRGGYSHFSRNWGSVALDLLLK